MGVKIEVFMHNLMSQNQLGSWSINDSNLQKYAPSNIEPINDYYECLIECVDEQSSCKRVCKEILL